MITHYIKVAWRNLFKQRLYSIITITGLAIGLSCFLVIFLYNQHELNYDKYYDNSDDIYRIFQRNLGNEYLSSDKIAYTPMALADALKSEFAEIEYSTTIRDHQSLLSVDSKNFLEDGLWADENFFQVFHHPLLQGNLETALSEPNSIVLNESLSKKIFGSENPVGKVVKFRERQEFVVTAIMDDLSLQTSIKYSFVIPITSNGQYAYDTKNDRWGNSDYYTFFSLVKGADASNLELKLPMIVDKYIKRRDDYKYEDSYHLQALSELHFEDNVNFDIGLKGNLNYVSMFSFIGLLVLLLACINYMNLSITKSMKRAKEVGIRKVVGASRKQLIAQFLSESIVISLIALAFSLAITNFATPFVGGKMDRTLALNIFDPWYLLPCLILLSIMVGSLSGSYAALVISSLKPSQIFKNKIDGFSGLNLQRILVVGQFAVSIFLIVSTLVIFLQFKFINGKELGYNKDNIIAINVNDRSLGNKIATLKNKWENDPNIVNVTTAWELPTNFTSSTLIHRKDQTKEDAMNIYRARVGHDYLAVFDIQLLEGRDFRKGMKSDSSEARIINETAARALGWTAEEAIGKVVVTGSTEKTIIGVTKDFHIHSMHLPIGPMLLQIQSEPLAAFIAVRVKPDNISQTLEKIDADVSGVSSYPFEYQYLDERFDSLYKADIRAGQMFGFFTLLSIFIAALGLFGLAAFTVEQRTKEIGIRKVLGANIFNIVTMLSKQFYVMVALGFVIAVPIAFYIMNNWLQKYAYRIELEWWIFAIGGFAALFIAALSVGMQSAKAAVRNPVKSLRIE